MKLPKNVFLALISPFDFPWLPLLYFRVLNQLITNEIIKLFGFPSSFFFLWNFCFFIPILKNSFFQFLFAGMGGASFFLILLYN